MSLRVQDLEGIVYSLMRYSGMVLLGQIVKVNGQVFIVQAFQFFGKQVGVYFHYVWRFAGREAFLAHAYVHACSGFYGLIQAIGGPMQQ